MDKLQGISDISNGTSKGLRGELSSLFSFTFQINENKYLSGRRPYVARYPVFVFARLAVSQNRVWVLKTKGLVLQTFK